MKEKNERMEELERFNKERENNLIKKMMKKVQIKEKYESHGRRACHTVRSHRKPDRFVSCQRRRNPESGFFRANL